jgi:hypothetical protein
MTVRSTLRSTASRFLHLEGIAPAAKKGAEDDAEKKAKKEAEEEEARKAKEEEDKKKAAAKAAKAAEGGENDDDEDDENEDDDDCDCKKAEAAGFGKSLDAAVRQERRRCAAIFSSEPAQGRVAMACELAFDLKSNMTAASAIRVLSASPKSQAATPLATALASQPRHDIGNGGAPKVALTPDQRLAAAAAERGKQAKAA